MSRLSDSFVTVSVGASALRFFGRQTGMMRAVDRWSAQFKHRTGAPMLVMLSTTLFGRMPGCR